MNRVLIHYHEIALKRGNRAWFVKQLENNIARMLRGTGIQRIERGPARIIVHLAEPDQWLEVRQRLTRVFGIANFLLSRRSRTEIEELTANILDALAGRVVKSFAVRCKRNDRTFPVPSPEVCRRIGHAVQERTGAAVDLSNPELTVHIEILPDQAFFSFEKVAGPGGLPLGSSGKVLALFSGGIDSPVAAHRMMQRGCEVEFVHFHGAPYQSRASRDKCDELMQVLNRWQPDARLHLVPFGFLQKEIVTQTPRPLRVVLYRRMMLRIACAVAAKVGAAALVTGESLGQVASQTLPNLAVIEQASHLPVLRPLIGMDKQEITNQAEVLGTYPISIQPDEDCCQLFVPRHPATRTTVGKAEEAEGALNIDAMVDKAVELTETVDFTFPSA